MENRRQHDTAGSRRENPLDPPTLLSLSLSLSLPFKFQLSDTLRQKTERGNHFDPSPLLPYEASRQRHISFHEPLVFP